MGVGAAVGEPLLKALTSGIEPSLTVTGDVDRERAARLDAHWREEVAAGRLRGPFGRVGLPSGGQMRYSFRRDRLMKGNIALDCTLNRVG